MGHRKGRMGAAARREGDFIAATSLAAGPERDFLLERAAHAGRHVGRGALKDAVEDPDFAPAQGPGIDYEVIAARYAIVDAPGSRHEDAWTDVATAPVVQTYGRQAG